MIEWLLLFGSIALAVLSYYYVRKHPEQFSVRIMNKSMITLGYLAIFLMFMVITFLYILRSI